jgi:hypothetical protein
MGRCQCVVGRMGRGCVSVDGREVGRLQHVEIMEEQSLHVPFALRPPYLLHTLICLTLLTPSCHPSRHQVWCRW